MIRARVAFLQALLLVERAVPAQRRLRLRIELLQEMAGRGWASVLALAEAVGQTVDQVRRTLRGLEVHGMARKRRKREGRASWWEWAA